MTCGHDEKTVFEREVDAWATPCCGSEKSAARSLAKMTCLQRDGFALGKQVLPSGAS